MFVFHGLNAAAIFWIAVVLIVFMSQFFSYRERTSRHRMIETLAEKGQPIPPEVLTSSRDYGSGWRHGNPIQSGIFLMCIGVALALFFWAMSGGGNIFEGDRVPSWLPFVGIFPFMIGLARLLAGVFDRRPTR
ncbi:MAG TPA: DUF6249 domain-containing protein [Rhizomicrobium sp.]|jgi:hypothetical protein